MVLVTHEPDIAAYAQRQIAFRDGVIAHDSRVPAPRDATERTCWGRVKPSSDGHVSVTPSWREEESV